ncbi:PD-(D/E)XK nuclease family protein [Candidatus Saccharibacteria bacterium]|nr:PD-(D/E)XK nuclease family protein [Candidatus Saccharibacteria bacterium]
MAYERSPSYQPGQKTAYKLSRSKIENFIRCSRCFWLDRRLGIGQPSMPPFLINSAVDELLKTEFDTYREKGQQHPWQIEFKIDAKPFKHAHLNRWRHTFTGVQHLHKPTNFLIFGGVDDVWETPKGELVVVDYKATAKNKEITDLEDSKWHDAYRRQMEVYQWLLRGEGHKVSDTGYFVYANGIAKGEGFFNKVEFRTNVFPYKGSDKWVEPTLRKIKDCLESDDMPKEAADCEYCAYARSRTELTITSLRNRKRKR